MRATLRAAALLVGALLCVTTPAQTAPAGQNTTPPTKAVPAANGPAVPAPAKTRVSPSQTAAAPGGGPGQVWVNTASKVYHCSGTAYYGKTKAGKYVTEDAAKAEGDRANGGKPCTK